MLVVTWMGRKSKKMGSMYTYGWFTLLYKRKYHNTVKRLYSSKNQKEKKKDYLLPSVLDLRYLLAEALMSPSKIIPLLYGVQILLHGNQIILLWLSGIDLKEEHDVKKQGWGDGGGTSLCTVHKAGSRKELCLILLPFLPTLVRGKGSSLSVLVNLSLGISQLANKLVVKFSLIWVRAVWPL